MDVMALRRMMAQMTIGARFEKGTITPKNNVEATISFQNTYEKYFIVLEATDASKTTIMNTQATTQKMFGLIAFYPKMSIDNNENNYNALAQVINPSTNVCIGSSLNIATATSSSFSFRQNDISTSNPYYLYNDLTYNYYIVEIK